MKRETAELTVEALKIHFIDNFHTEPDFRLSDHTYDNLTPGSWTVSHEGWRGENPWPYEVTWHSTIRGLPDGVFLDAINHYSLGIFDA